MLSHSLYLHIPFCQKRCSYCDFNTFAGISHLIPAYVKALIREIEGYQSVYAQKTPLKSIFFGGGTPSLLSADQFELIFQTINHNFIIEPDAEITIEANPGTVSLDYLRNIKNMGVNRISFGVQTTHKGDFELMGRIHDYPDAIEAVKFARLAGFKNINVDLIYGLPDQSLFAWKTTLDHILNLKVEHISLYALGIEENTPLYEWVEHGLVNDPDPDLTAEMYETACEVLQKHGFFHYEISNFAKGSDTHDYRCLHNLQYWRNLPYFGLGAGAHGYFNRQRTENITQVGTYLQVFKENSTAKQLPAVAEFTPISHEREMQETMMVGLRLLKEGVSLDQFSERFGEDLLQVFSTEIEKLTALGLLEVKPDCVILTQKGYLLGNVVFREFV